MKKKLKLNPRKKVEQIQRFLLQKRFNVIRIALFRSKEEKEKTQDKEEENKDVGITDKKSTDIEDNDAKSSVAEFSSYASMYTFPNVEKLAKLEVNQARP